MDDTKAGNQVAPEKRNLATMKIAHLLWSLATGGVETMLVDIINEQVKSESVFLIIINDDINEDLYRKIDSGVQVHCIGRKPGSRNPWPAIKLNILLKRIMPDILHCHLDDQTKLIWGHYNMVRTIHNTHSSSKDFHKFKRLFCISGAVKKHTASQGFPQGIVIFNGIHTEQICSNPIDKRHNDGIKKIVCVGRLHEDKGQRVLIEAVDELVNKRGKKNFTVDLIGDGPLRKELLDNAGEKKLSEYVHFLGMKTREWFYPRLCEYDLFVMPSISEGFGLTLAEAVAAKLPVITSNLEGPMEVIDNGRLGRCFKSGDASALADAICEFLSYGRDQQQIEEAYRYVKEHFDVKETARKYLEEYRILL